MPPTPEDIDAARASTYDAYQFFRAQMEFGNPGGMTDILEILTSRMSVAFSAARERGAREEREACAQLALDRASNWGSFAAQEESEGDPYGDNGPETFGDWEHEAKEIAAAIRARGTT